MAVPALALRPHLPVLVHGPCHCFLNSSTRRSRRVVVPSAITTGIAVAVATTIDNFMASATRTVAVAALEATRHQAIVTPTCKGWQSWQSSTQRHRRNTTPYLLKIEASVIVGISDRVEGLGVFVAGYEFAKGTAA